MDEIGRVTIYFAKPSVAAVLLTAPLRVGETIYLKGHTTDFQQVVESMEVDHVHVQEAAAEQSVGIRVTGKCRKHDVVYKLAG